MAVVVQPPEVSAVAVPGTVLCAIRTLMACGAKDVILAVTHGQGRQSAHGGHVPVQSVCHGRRGPTVPAGGLFSGAAIERINTEPAITKVIVSNTVPQDRNVQLCSKLEVVDVSEFMSRAVRIMHCGGSLSALFDLSDRLGTSLDMAKGKYDSPPPPPPV